MPATSLVLATTQVPARQPIMPLRVRHRTARLQYRIAPHPVGGAAKRFFDVVAAGAALLLLSPFLLLVAFLIQLESPGPIFFRQHRTGFRGRRFKIIKFRTMMVVERGSCAIQAQPDDPRITRLGNLLRRTSIDELPQLINVLVGDMSLVGPRPHALAHDHAFCDAIGDYPLRFVARPGITGEAQVCGARGPTDEMEKLERRLRFDLSYVRGWSMRHDLAILARTVPLVVADKVAF
jgi:lipopolysaccharide/colanic/teichoic acid biosynthesis glycosyltransferase